MSEFLVFKRLLPGSLFLLAVFGVATVKAQDCAEFKKSVAQIYGFRPSELTDAQINAKSAEMDVFWNKAKASQKVYLPCLRDALNTPTTDAFFLFDASNLLMSLDPTDDSKRILIKSYAAVSFDDIDPRFWLPRITVLGFEGFDTSAAGENWLRARNPSYTLPQHAGKAVDKRLGAFCIYGAMDESMATPALLKVAATENHPGRTIAIEILLHQLTPASLAGLKSFNRVGLSETVKTNVYTQVNKPVILAGREGAPKITRAQYLDAFQQLVSGKTEAFMKLATEVPDGERDAIAVLKPEDIPLVRKARRVFAASANPHAIEWYQSFSKILLAMTSEPAELKKE